MGGLWHCFTHVKEITIRCQTGLGKSWNDFWDFSAMNITGLGKTFTGNHGLPHETQGLPPKFPWTNPVTEGLVILFHDFWEMALNPHPRMVCDALENSCLHCSFFPIARTFLVGSRLLLAMLSFLFFVDWIAISIRSTPCALSWPANRVTYLVLSDIGSCCRPWPSLDTMQDS